MDGDDDNKKRLMKIRRNRRICRWWNNEEVEIDEMRKNRGIWGITK